MPAMRLQLTFVMAWMEGGAGCVPGGVATFSCLGVQATDTSNAFEVSKSLAEPRVLN